MSLPKNLKQLISGPHEGFRLVHGHYAELKHGLMGTFPAVERESQEPVITADFGLLRRVVETLSPRRHEFGFQLLYLNDETGVAFSVLGCDEHSLERSEPFHLFTQARFDELTTTETEASAFMWAPGLVGDDMSREEFIETLEAAARIHAEA